MIILGALWMIAIVTTGYYAVRTVQTWEFDNVLRMNIANAVQVALMVSMLVMYLMGVYNG